MYEIFMNIGNYQGKDFSNYEVSNLGNVRNANTKKVLKTKMHVINNTGYKQVLVNLHDTNHKQHTIVVARLVISTFKANSENKPQVGHLNDDSTDNRLNNLYYTTAAENNTYNGRSKRVAEKNKKKVECIELNKIFDSATDAADWLGNKQARTNITACCKGKQKSAYGYTWKYFEGEDNNE